MSGRKTSSIKTVITVLICLPVVFCTVFIIYTGSGRRSAAVTSIPVQAKKQVSQTDFIIAEEASSFQSFEDYINETIFIGDSRTNGLAVYNYIPEENVLAKDGENHRSARTEKIIHSKSGKDITIAQAVAEKKPVRMIVSFGINGVSFMDEESFMDDFSALLDELHNASPDSVLVVQSILPVSKNLEISKPTLTNSVIDHYNKLLKKLADKKEFLFLDSSSILKDKNNCLAAQYDSGDGLHFNKTAYDALLQFYNKNRV